MITDNKLVKDYMGNLVSKDKARKILGKYYVDGESCFKLEDGQWYRITSTDKIAFDHYKNCYVLKESTKLLKGIINDNLDEGLFSENDDYIVLIEKCGQSKHNLCINERVATKLGYVECLNDGHFYKKENLTEEDKSTWFSKKNIPASERSKSYNLESDPDRKKQLEKAYENYNPKISISSKRIAKIIGNYTLGMEAEVINGFIPKRIRAKLGIKALKDGSLRDDKGEGIEYCTVPLQGPKGIQLIKEFCTELSKRCEVNNLCSVHFHFGNVRKDKLYILSLYKLISDLQEELMKYFPYSRFNSIKADGKVYCKPLMDLKIDYKSILSSTTEELFHKNTVDQFNKIYTWLNHGKSLAEPYGETKIVRETTVINGKKMFYDKWLRNVYSTKTIHHSIQGNKWDKAERYFLVNFLNLYFTKTNTVEFRCHEGSTNSTKCLIWLMICASILKYAENIKDCFKASKINLKQVLQENMSISQVKYVMDYLHLRNTFFFSSDKVTYKSNYKVVETKWFLEDPDFSFKRDNIDII